MVFLLFLRGRGRLQSASLRADTATLCSGYVLSFCFMTLLPKHNLSPPFSSSVDAYDTALRGFLSLKQKGFRRLLSLLPLLCFLPPSSPSLLFIVFFVRWMLGFVSLLFLEKAILLFLLQCLHAPFLSELHSLTHTLSLSLSFVEKSEEEEE